MTTRRKNTKTTASVVKAEYRKEYEDGSCGDALSKRLKQHITNADGKTDLAKLRALAERNGVWSASYANLNPGMVRMNCGNRLRKIVRDGNKIVWK